MLKLGRTKHLFTFGRIEQFNDREVNTMFKFLSVILLNRNLPNQDLIQGMIQGKRFAKGRPLLLDTRRNHVHVNQ